LRYSPKALENLKGTYKDQQPLLPALQRHVLKKAAEDENDRRTDILHPSAMSSSDWCHRHDFYGIIGSDKSSARGGATTFRRELIYDYGHGIHNKYQTWFWEMGILWGRWKCDSCAGLGEVATWLGWSPDECPNCGAERPYITYDEVPLGVKKYRLGGHADGLVYDGQKNVLIEIKSIGIGSLRFDAPRLYERYVSQDLTLDQVWYRIQRPFGKHLRQGLIYLAEIQEKYPELEVDDIVFIYEWKPNQDTKSFSVKQNPRIVDPLLEKAAQVTEAVKVYNDSGEVQPPPRPEWAESITGKVCKSCDYRGICWGEPDPEDISAETPTVRVRKAAKKRRPKT
jgi:hypothetical protein